MKEILKLSTAIFGGAAITSLFITHSQNWMIYAPIFLLSIGLFIYSAFKN
jgi:hypothetical protein